MDLAEMAFLQLYGTMACLPLDLLKPAITMLICYGRLRPPVAFGLNEALASSFTSIEAFSLSWRKLLVAFSHSWRKLLVAFSHS